MSTLLTPGKSDPGTNSKQAGTFYDHKAKGYASSIAEIKRLFGPNAIQKAKAVVAELSDDDTKKALRTDLGNDPAVIHRVLEFNQQAKNRRAEVLKEFDGNLMYDNSPTMARGRVDYVENEIRSDFQKMIGNEAKQDFIDRNQTLDYV